MLGKGLKRSDTIASTLEDAKFTLGDNPPKTRLRSGRNGGEPAKPKAAPKPKLTKTKTMAATQKEAKALLGDEEVGHTRSTPAKAAAPAPAAEPAEEDAKAASPVAAAATPKLKKTKTMAETAAEGKEITGAKKRGKTRQETSETPKLKKTKTMAATAKVVCSCPSLILKEGEEFVAREDKKKK